MARPSRPSPMTIETMKSFRQYLWEYGEVGDRITAIRDNKMYEGSAHTIENLLLTNLGNLSVAKDYDSNTMAEILGTVIRVTDTLYDFFIVVTTSEVITVAKSDYSVLSSYSITLSKDTSVTVMEEFIMLLSTSQSEILEMNIETGALAVSNYKSSMKLPLRLKESVVVDVYKIKSYDSVLSPYLMTTLSNPELSYDSTSGDLSLGGTPYVISRIYSPYVANLYNEDIPSLVEGDYFIVLYNYDTVEDATWMLGNEPLTWTGQTTDSSGQYWTGCTMSADAEGKLDYGILISLDDYMTSAVEFQNRLVISTGQEIFFSALYDYNNFRNGANDEDSFYFKLSPINGEQPTVLRMDAGRGLVITTDKGVYMVAYNDTVTPSDIPIRQISDDPGSSEGVLIDDSYWYLNSKDILKCIQNISTETGYVEFKGFWAEKYSIYHNLKSLRLARIDGRNYLLANTDEGDKVYLYQAFGTNKFNRLTLTITGEVYPHEDLMFKTGGYLEQSTNNMTEAMIKLNVPYIYTRKGGHYLNDVASRIKRCVVKLLDEDNEAINYMKVNDVILNRLGESVSGLYSVYKTEESIPVKDGVEILIVTNQNSKLLEIQATEQFYTSEGD